MSGAMLPASQTKILRRLNDGDLVLDVGGWAKPWARADWVIDLMPYETRGLYGEPDPGPERFSARSWVQRDFCDREPWPFADRQFDFAVCAHTLEDVRDPIWVCSELTRVARAGYVEVPSRLEEQSRRVHGDWIGWSHHHWLVDVEPGRIQFVFKTHVLPAYERYHFPAEFGAALTPEERVQTMFWQDGFTAFERVFIDPDELDEYLASFVQEHQRLAEGRFRPGAAGGPVRRMAQRLRGLNAGRGR